MFVLIAWLGCGDTPPEPLPAPEPPPVAPEPPPPVPIVWEDRYAGAWVVVAYAGSVNAPAAVTRTKDEARARAEELRTRALAEDFASVAASSSDAPDRDRGGSLGTWLTGTYEPSVEEAVARTEIDGLSAVVETPWGFAVVKRLPIVQAHALQIVVAWQGSEPRQVLRTHDEAKARAEGALARLAAGEDFAAVARELSDDASAPSGGDLGVTGPGQLVPAVDRALFALKDGETSGLVEAPFGYVIVRRVSP